MGAQRPSEALPGRDSSWGSKTKRKLKAKPQSIAGEKKGFMGKKRRFVWSTL